MLHTIKAIAALASGFFFFLMCTFSAHSQMVLSSDQLDSLVERLPLVRGQERAALLYDLGFMYPFHDAEKGLYYANEVLKEGRRNKDLNAQVEGLYLIGRSQRYNKELALALETLLKGRELINHDGVSRKAQLNILREIGNVYALSNHASEALMYMKKCLRLLDSAATAQDRFMLLESVGFLYLEVNADSAYHYFTNLIGASAQDTTDDVHRFFYFRGLSGLGESLYMKKQPADALTYLLRFHSHGREIGSTSDVANNFRLLGGAYLELGNLALADSLLQTARAIATKANDWEVTLKTYQLLAQLAEANGDYADALEAMKIANEIKGNRLSTENYEGINLVEKQHEQNKLIARMKAEQRRVSRLNQWLLVALLGGAFLLGIFGLAIRSNRLRKRSNIELAMKNREIQQQARDLQQQKEELSRLNEMKDRMISIISHDFRSPLNSLRGVLTLLQIDDLSQQQLDTLLKDITKRINSNLSLIENLLHWTRSQLVGNTLEPVIFDLRDTAQEVVTLFSSIAAEKGIVLKNEVEQSVFVKADCDMMTFVVRNLVSNSLKFTHASGTVALSAQVEDGQVMIKVSDTGIGMSRETVGKLFLVQGHRSTLGTAKEKGMGIGLLICQQFVEQHGSRLEVNSEESKGTTFYFWLPVVDAYSLSQGEL